MDMASSANTAPPAQPITELHLKGPSCPDRSQQTGHDLAQQQQARDRDGLVHQHLGLARGIARCYTGRGVDAEDLSQVALLALVVAAGRFEVERGSSFGAYATVSIHGSLKRHLRDHAWAVRPPRAIHDIVHQVSRATVDLTHTLGAVPTATDIATYLGISPEQVNQARTAQFSYAATSLDALTHEHFAGTSYVPPALVSTGTADAADLALMIESVVHALPPRDQQIVRLRFEHDMTQQEIGDHLGISQMQVSRLLSALTARLKTQLAHVA